MGGVHALCCVSAIQARRAANRDLHHTTSQSTTSLASSLLQAQPVAELAGATEQLPVDPPPLSPLFHLPPPSLLQAQPVAELAGAAEQLPVEIPLGREFVFHSIFACPVSRDQVGA